MFCEHAEDVEVNLCNHLLCVRFTDKIVLIVRYYSNLAIIKCFDFSLYSSSDCDDDYTSGGARRWALSSHQSIGNEFGKRPAPTVSQPTDIATSCVRCVPDAPTTTPTGVSLLQSLLLKNVYLIL